MEAVTSATFQEAVLSHPGPVLVDFWGPQCAPCLALMPTVERLAERYADRVRVVKVNARENPRLCIQLKVSGLPTYALYKSGVEVARVAGATATAKSIEELIRQELEG